jgi:4-amino-4-deoxy-L-arabinose transferase-like glycosyltransferase
MSQNQKIVLALVIFLTIFFRFFQITQMPGGLFPDEAANGLDINSMQQGQLQPFYERGNGREALFFYMLWGSVEVFGKGAWQHHAVSALVGVLSVLTCFLVTRRLFSMNYEQEETGFQEKYFKATNIALLASFIMAVSSWHTVLSRTAFRANLIPLFSALTIYFLLATYQAATNKKRVIFSLLTGAAFALGFYTYIAYRILVPILAMAIVWPFLFNGLVFNIKRFWKNFLLFIVAFVIFIYPLAHYFYTHPGSFIGRSGQVSVFNPSLYTIDGQSFTGVPPTGVVVKVVGEVLKLSILGYFTVGDLNWRHNISGEPFLSSIVSPFFGVSLLVITLLAVWYMFFPRKKSEYWKYFLLVGWFWGMLLPVVTTAEGIPHGLRAIGTIPVVFIISALGIYKVHELFVKVYEKFKAYQSEFSQKLVKAGYKLVVFCFAFALISQTYVLYFVYAANSPENYYAFRSDLTPVNEYLINRCMKDSTYLVLDKFSVQTPDYVTMVDGRNLDNPCNQPYKQVDPENVWELKGLRQGDEVIFTQSSIFDIAKFKRFHPEATLVLEYRNKFGQAIMAVYRISN